MEVLLEEDVEIADHYTRALIDGVISDGVSGTSTQKEMPDEDRTKDKKDDELIAKEFKNGQRPDFELCEIMGEFEIDDSGNYIILRGEKGQLLDKNLRPVNKRGYMIDRAGNVINRRCELIFRAIELDSDDEIPAPLGFEKRK